MGRPTPVVPETEATELTTGLLFKSTTVQKSDVQLTQVLRVELLATNGALQVYLSLLFVDAFRTTVYSAF